MEEAREKTNLPTYLPYISLYLPYISLYLSRLLTQVAHAARTRTLTSTLTLTRWCAAKTIPFSLPSQMTDEGTWGDIGEIWGDIGRYRGDMGR